MSTTELPFIKCHGSGNDFILIDERSSSSVLSPEQRSRMALLLCDRKGGIGADGILFVLNSEVASGRMIIVNSDGSEPEMCGNGLRCVARYISEAKGLLDFHIETKGGVYAVERVDDFFEQIPAYSIRIDTISWGTDDVFPEANAEKFLHHPLPFLESELLYSMIKNPNPHLVAQTAGPDTALLSRIGQRCNGNRDHFPKGTNVNLFYALAENAIFVETYERGVGLTNACGTGMLATSIIARTLEVIPPGQWITVYNKGGFVKCRVNEVDGHIQSADLLGNATYEWEGLVSLDWSNPADFLVMTHRVFEAEIMAYERLRHFAQNRIATT
ncbi:MAG TPA: diaminopimelate epimerase [Saprospiraceae bacterium]|nr:diaminopimelate epimerase [Saprospiraceae bacterium]HMQ81803.1 diaminopimelate epimerase [Saprospiraceae bacterium]